MNDAADDAVVYEALKLAHDAETSPWKQATLYRAMRRFEPNRQLELKHGRLASPYKVLTPERNDAWQAEHHKRMAEAEIK